MGVKFRSVVNHSDYKAYTLQYTLLTGKRTRLVNDSFTSRRALSSAVSIEYIIRFNIISRINFTIRKVLDVERSERPRMRMRLEMQQSRLIE